MSEAIFARLPRFDTGAERRPIDWMKDLEGDAGGAGPLAFEPEMSFDSGMSEPGEEADMIDLPAASPVPDTSAVESLLASLSELMGRVEREATEQAQTALRALALQLFPELGRQFLAEEIGRHLPGLIPRSAPLIELRAGPDLAAQLQQVIDRNPALSGRCTVIPEAEDGPGRAELSWQSGGVTFDFSGLFETCLAQLNSKT